MVLPEPPRDENGKTKGFNHGDIMKYVGNVVQTTRERPGAENRAEYLTKVRNAMGNIILSRIEEFEVGLVRDFKLK
jgi:hypothetical protein